MSRILILGGTRNLGHVTAIRALNASHDVTVLNRGITSDELPGEIERIRAARGDASFRSAVAKREFDVVVDLTTYNRNDAIEAVETFTGKTGRYVFISSGQVYLVRTDAKRPFREDDYAGPVMTAPLPNTKDYDSWKYGVDKRDAEDVFSRALEVEDFPVTTLRLPMVASERDHYGRIQGYFARILDGNPILVPDEKGLPVRHVYVDDVARAILVLCESSAGIGNSYNISYGSSLSLAEYMSLLETVVGITPQLIKTSRESLERADLLPDCSSFSGTWMSELDAANADSKLFSGKFDYSAPRDYLPHILEDYVSRWTRAGRVPDTYEQRGRELDFIRHLAM